jgi:hypothetical protein
VTVDAAPGPAALVETLTISVDEAGRLVGISGRRVRQLAEKGVVPPIDKGKVPLVGFVQGYVRYLREEAHRSTQTQGVTEVQRERAAEIRQRREAKAGTLVPRDEAFAVVNEVIGGLASDLAGLPAAISRDREVRQRVKRAIDGILNRAADRIERQGGPRKPRRGAAAAAAAADA